MGLFSRLGRRLLGALLRRVLPSFDRLGERLRAAADEALALLQVHLDAASADLQDLLQRSLDALLRAAAGLLLLGLGLVWLTALAVVLAGEAHRAWVLGAAAALHLLGGAWLLQAARARLRPPGGAFPALRQRLAADRAAVQPAGATSAGSAADVPQAAPATPAPGSVRR